MSVDVKFTRVDRATIEPNSSYMDVEVEGVEEQEIVELLDEIDLDDIIDRVGRDKILDAIGKDEVIEYFDIEEKEDE